MIIDEFGSRLVPAFEHFTWIVLGLILVLATTVAAATTNDYSDGPDLLAGTDTVLSVNSYVTNVN